MPEGDSVYLVARRLDTALLGRRLAAADLRVPGRLLPDVRVVLGSDAGSTAYGLHLPVVELVETQRETDVVGHLGPDPLATTGTSRRR